jgi:hypothetical protein
MSEDLKRRKDIDEAQILFSSFGFYGRKENYARSLAYLCNFPFRSFSLNSRNLEHITFYPIAKSQGISGDPFPDDLIAECPKQRPEAAPVPKAGCQHLTFLSSDNLGVAPNCTNSICRTGNGSLVRNDV